MATDDRKRRILEHLSLSSEIIKPKPENKPVSVETIETEEVDVPEPPKTIPNRKSNKEERKKRIVSHLNSSSSDFKLSATQSQENQRKQRIQDHVRKSLN